MESSANFIDCRSVTRFFYTAARQKTHALAEVNLSIKENEFLCLLGPSGCGKTTLLNLIAGFLQPSKGQILVEGQRVLGPGPDRGVVFQDYSLFPWLTVRENVEFGPRMAGFSREERRGRGERYLSLVGLSKFAEKYPFELSGGMKQRVAIARSLVNNPKVLLMDEPFAALDAMTRAGLQSELLEIQQAEKKTIVFVTHNISEAIFLADRVVVMSPHPGRIREVMNVELERPRSRTTSGFNELYENLERSIGVHTVE